MLSLITNAILDVGYGIIWWTSKKTFNALYYGASYLFWNEDSAKSSLPDEDDFIIMSDFKELLIEKNNRIKELEDELNKLK
jgi:hypothetical protein